MNKITKWMNRTTSSLLAIALCLVALEMSQAAEPEPLEFKGVKLGSSEAELRAKFPQAKCRPYSNNNGSTCGVNNSSIANVPARAGFTFESGKLILIVLNFNKSSFDTVAKALKTKYGPSTQAGVDSGADVIGWARGSGSIEIFKFRDGTEATVSFLGEKLKPYVADRTPPPPRLPTPAERDKAAAEDL